MRLLPGPNHPLPRAPERPRSRRRGCPLRLRSRQRAARHILQLATWRIRSRPRFRRTRRRLPFPLGSRRPRSGRGPRRPQRYHKGSRARASRRQPRRHQRSHHRGPPRKLRARRCIRLRSPRPCIRLRRSRRIRLRRSRRIRLRRSRRIRHPPRRRCIRQPDRQPLRPASPLRAGRSSIPGQTMPQRCRRRRARRYRSASSMAQARTRWC
jgi:hypothetical protein